MALEDVSLFFVNFTCVLAWVSQVWYLIVLSPDLCLLTSFNLLKKIVDLNVIFKVSLNVHRPKKHFIFYYNKSHFRIIQNESFLRKGALYTF